ncbi:hypothetical protein Bca52824_092331 [Brassica carinata]|uniref:Uncharacterized protein n=1 Tax=Brassica carinata TaxID=52824 RepID=A0A8X7NTM1_BRACI|nr:hypothetical protein Bca52824_092331 [Brassica carinata]
MVGDESFKVLNSWRKLLEVIPGLMYPSVCVVSWMGLNKVFEAVMYPSWFFPWMHLEPLAFRCFQLHEIWKSHGSYFPKWRSCCTRETDLETLSLDFMTLMLMWWGKRPVIVIDQEVMVQGSMLILLESLLGSLFT